MDNPLWGAPRIHGELLKLGFEVAQSSVAKYMVRQRGPRGQGWLTFLRNHAPDIAAMAPLRRPDDRLQPPLCIRNRSDTAQRPRLDQRHKGSDGRMGCTPNYRGISLGRSSKISPSRPGSNLWGSRHTSIVHHGHQGQADCALRIYVGSFVATRTIILKFGRTDHWTKMRRDIARSSELDSSGHSRSWVVFIIISSGRSFRYRQRPAQESFWGMERVKRSASKFVFNFSLLEQSLKSRSSFSCWTLCWTFYCTLFCAEHGAFCSSTRRLREL